MTTTNLVELIVANGQLDDKMEYDVADLMTTYEISHIEATMLRKALIAERNKQMGRKEVVVHQLKKDEYHSYMQGEEVRFPKDYIKVATVTVETKDVEEALGLAFELTNSISCPWSTKTGIEGLDIEPGPDALTRHRSTSVGDVMVVDGSPCRVAPVGWDRLEGDRPLGYFEHYCDECGHCIEEGQSYQKWVDGTDGRRAAMTVHFECREKDEDVVHYHSYDKGIPCGLTVKDDVLTSYRSRQVTCPSCVAAMTAELKRPYLNIMGGKVVMTDLQQPCFRGVVITKTEQIPECLRSSSIDYPEEFTDDAAVIELCKMIRR